MTSLWLLLLWFLGLGNAFHSVVPKVAESACSTQRHSAVLQNPGSTDSHAVSDDVDNVGASRTPDEDFVNLRNEIRAHENSELYRRYSSVIPMTVALLRKQHGQSPSWWGDLNARETRLLYWQLLPTVLLVENEFNGLPLKDRAYVASMARYAAKLYARERSMVPHRAAAGLFDGVRYALKYGRWSWTGMSVEEIWLKYEREIKEEMLAAAEEAAACSASSSPDASCRPECSQDVLECSVDAQRAMESAAVDTSVAINEEELYRRLYQKILRKSCATNPLIDRFAISSLESLALPTANGGHDSPTHGTESRSGGTDGGEKLPIVELLRVGRAKKAVTKMVKGVSTRAMVQVLALVERGGTHRDSANVTTSTLNSDFGEGGGGENPAIETSSGSP